MLFIDADALAKLAHWQILPILPTITGMTWNRMATISSLKHRAHRASTKPDGRLFHCPHAAARACAAIAHMSDAGAPDPKVLESFVQLSGIDTGEATLLALTLKHPEHRFLTGDKRAIRSLAQSSIATQWSSRIWVVEQMVHACLNLHGRHWLLENVCPFRNIDIAISNCLGSTCEAKMDDIVEGLHSYLSELHGLATPSLIAAMNTERSISSY